jgi:hypothetical protein
LLKYIKTAVFRGAQQNLCKRSSNARRGERQRVEASWGTHFQVFFTLIIICENVFVILNLFCIVLTFVWLELNKIIINRLVPAKTPCREWTN